MEVSTSSFLAHEAEKLTIENVSDDGLTITTLENLKHDHVVISEDFDEKHGVPGFLKTILPKSKDERSGAKQ